VQYLKNQKNKKKVFIIIILSFYFLTPLSAQQKKFIDTLDNAFDISHYMYNLNGLLPIPSPITEPAVGFGAALAAVYFIPKKKTDSLKFQMPDIAAVAGGLTENKTWFLGAGYIGFWKNDNIRYRGIIGYGDIKLKYYGNNNNFLNNNPINFSLQSSFLLQQLMFRIKSSNIMLGGRYIYSKSKVTLFDKSDSKWISPKEINVQNSGIGGIAEFENYDNILSPNKGLRININYFQSLEVFGSDMNFGRLTAFTNFYFNLFKKRLVSGFRIETQMATGNAPFYMKPFIILRGIPAMRFQGDIVGLIETNQLFSITKRWSIVGFAGAGTISKTDNKFKDPSQIWNYGGGFRYLIARRLGLRMGIDLAKSYDNWGIYIIFGSAWIR